MASEWKLLVNGADLGTFALLKLAELSRTLINQGIDEVAFSAPAVALDGSALCEYGDTVRITRDDENWFSGRCISLPRFGNAQTERISYKLAGPWWYLEKMVYQQRWGLWDTEEAAITPSYKSRVILCQDENGDGINSGAQIIDAVNYAIAQGAPITLGTVDADINYPMDECIDITIAEVIVKMLRIQPDRVCYFDYSTANPTLHVIKRSSLPAVSLELAGAYIESASISPRYDLQIPGVIVRFEQLTTVETTVEGEEGEPAETLSKNYESVTVQEAGITNDLETLVSTIALAGSNFQYAKQRIVTDDIPEDLTSAEGLAWWLRHIPALKTASEKVGTTLTIISATSLGTLPRFLVWGQLHDWLIDKYDLSFEEDVFTLKMRIQRIDPVTGAAVTSEEDFSLEGISTDAKTRTYSARLDYETGESVPEGVADALYAALHPLQYDGSFVLVEEECSGLVLPGRSVNVTGLKTEWETMNALVQQINEDLDNGRTTITFGPARHLTAEELTGLLQGFRTRSTSKGFAKKADGDYDDDPGNIDLSGVSPKNGAASVTQSFQKIKMSNVSGSITKTIDVDPTIIPGTTSRTMQPREIDVCVAGVAKKQVFMCSEAY